MHKNQRYNFVLNLFKIILLLQIDLQLKGYRYKVGRGVLKTKYILAPNLVPRQLQLSLFYFKKALLRRTENKFFFRVLAEFFEVLLHDSGESVQLVHNVYNIAQDFRMFTVKEHKMKKRILRKKKKRTLFLIQYLSLVRKHSFYLMGTKSNEDHKIFYKPQRMNMLWKKNLFLKSKYNVKYFSYSKAGRILFMRAVFHRNLKIKQVLNIKNSIYFRFCFIFRKLNELKRILLAASTTNSFENKVVLWMMLIKYRKIVFGVCNILVKYTKFKYFSRKLKKRYLKLYQKRWGFYAKSLVKLMFLLRFIERFLLKGESLNLTQTKKIDLIMQPTLLNFRGISKNVLLKKKPSLKLKSKNESFFKMSSGIFLSCNQVKKVYYT